MAKRLLGRESSEINGGVQPGIFQKCDKFFRECTSSTIKFKTESVEVMDPFPGLGRMNLAGFAIGDLGYAGLGIECIEKIIEGENAGDVNLGVVPKEDLVRPRTFYSFNPHSAPGTQWQQVASFPGSGDNLFAFSLNLRGYVVFKQEDGSNILWQFDPLSGPDGGWTELGRIPYPSDVDPYHLFSIGNISYIYFPTSRNNFWMYIPELD